SRRRHTRCLSDWSSDVCSSDLAIVTDVIGARDAPRDGVSGKWVLDRLPRSVRAGWAPTLDDAARLALRWATPGDVVVTLGVGERSEERRVGKECRGGRTEGPA